MLSGFGFGRVPGSLSVLLINLHDESNKHLPHRPDGCREDDRGAAVGAAIGSGFLRL